MITKKEVLDNLEEVKKYINDAENKVEEKVVGLAIKNRLTGDIIFQSSKTTFKEAIIEKGGAYLCGAYLCGAYLCGAYLCGAPCFSESVLCTVRPAINSCFLHNDNEYFVHCVE